MTSNNGKSDSIVDNEMKNEESDTNPKVSIPTVKDTTLQKSNSQTTEKTNSGANEPPTDQTKVNSLKKMIKEKKFFINMTK